MTFKELVNQIKAALDNGAMANSPVIIEGHHDDELFQREVESVTTERRCEDDDEPPGVYLNFKSEEEG